MESFQVSKNLLRSAHHLGKVGRCHVLLKNNAHYSWFLIVPETECEEMFQLAPDLLNEIHSYTDLLSQFIVKTLGSFKINMGQIGNVVPQLHIHVVGRNSGDPAWPAPVWGHPEKEKYTEEAVLELQNKLLEARLLVEEPIT